MGFGWVCWGFFLFDCLCFNEGNYKVKLKFVPSFQRLTLMAVFIATFLFSLTWQFNQFMMLIQALALFILDCLDMLPTAKVTFCLEIIFFWFFAFIKRTVLKVIFLTSGLDAQSNTDHTVCLVLWSNHSVNPASVKMNDQNTISDIFFTLCSSCLFHFCLLLLRHYLTLLNIILTVDLVPQL